MPSPLDPYDPVFEAAGKAWDVDPVMLKAIAAQETGGTGNPRLTSPAGAQGLMQIVPSTQRLLGGMTNPYDPVESIWFGAKYMSQALAAEGNPEKALLYYHGGPGWRNAYGRESEGYVPGVAGYYRGFQTAAGGQGAPGAPPGPGGPPAPSQAAPGPVASATPSQPTTIPLPNRGSSPAPGLPVPPVAGPAAAPTPAAPPPIPPAPAPAPPRPSLILGDSLASRQGLGGQGVTAANPKAVLAQIDGLLPEQITGRRIILSSGASNDPARAYMLAEQLDHLRRAGAADVTVVGVGTRPDFQGVNDQLQQISRQSGARFVPIDPRLLSPDRVHPTPQGYQLLRRQIGAG